MPCTVYSSILNSVNQAWYKIGLFFMTFDLVIILWILGYRNNFDDIVFFVLWHLINILSNIISWVLNFFLAYYSHLILLFYYLFFRLSDESCLFFTSIKYLYVLISWKKVQILSMRSFKNMCTNLLKTKFLLSQWQ